MSTFWRAGMWTSPTVVGRVVIRKKPITGLSRRIVSSNAFARHRRIVAQQLPLLRFGGQVAKGEGDAAYGRVDARRKERADQHGALVWCQTCRLGSVVDRRADAVGPERVTRTCRGHPRDRVGGIGDGRTEPVVRTPLPLKTSEP